MTPMDDETHPTIPGEDDDDDFLHPFRVIVPALLLAEGLPAAEDILKLLGEAESRSEQISVLQRAWSRAGRPMLEEDAVAVLGKLNKADSRSSQVRVLQFASAKFATLGALDAAVRPVVLSGPQFTHTCRLVQRASSSGGLSPEALAGLLDQTADELGRFLSAAQAQELVERIAAPPGQEAAYWHVACARVVDSWHVNERSHSAAACQFGWELSYTLQLAATACATGRDGALAPAALLTRVLSAMGRGHPETAHSANVAEYAQAIMAQQSGASSSCRGGGSSSSSTL